MPNLFIFYPLPPRHLSNKNPEIQIKRNNCFELVFWSEFHSASCSSINISIMSNWKINCVYTAHPARYHWKIYFDVFIFLRKWNNRNKSWRIRKKKTRRKQKRKRNEREIRGISNALIVLLLGMPYCFVCCLLACFLSFYYFFYGNSGCSCYLRFVMVGAHKLKL